MAKNKDDRYSNMEELLADLEAVYNGQTPLRAHERFDISMFEELEEGEEIEDEQDIYQEAIINRYRLAVIILSVVTALSVIWVILSIAI